MSSCFFRALREKEIEVKTDVITVEEVMNKEGNLDIIYKMPLRLYKNARVDQIILDKTVGPLKWMKRHEVRDRKVFCTVSIKNPKTNEWISKEDVGSAGYATFEGDKAVVSDSFKRACYAWGIGRELYTIPYDFHWEYKEKKSEKGPFNIERTAEGDLICPDKIVVDSIKYNTDKEIIFIRLKNLATERVFEQAMEWRENQKVWTMDLVRNPWQDWE